MFIDGLSSHSNSSMQTVIRTIELVLLSAGFISTMLMFKGAVESSCSYDMVFTTLKKPWSYFRSWLSSPFYICIIMNLIVIFIAASSLFHHHKMDNNGDAANASVSSTEDDDFGSSWTPSSMQNNHQKYSEYAKKESVPAPAWAPAAADSNSFENHHNNDLWQDAQVQKSTFKIESLTKEKEIKKANSLDSSANPNTITTESKSETKGTENQAQQELSREQQKPENAEEVDTMESMWRTITGEGAKSKNKQLKKSETWSQPPDETLKPSDSAKKELKKSMTFNETVSIRCRGGLMRDPSMSLEEFNGRVEDFIKKFNTEMRLQRQESEQRYLEMINRSI